MLVTIFADASFCPRSGASGWAGWAKSERGSVKHSGRLKVEVGEATECEMAAIANAVAMAKKAGISQYGDTLLIESDCLAAMHMLERRTPGQAILHTGKRWRGKIKKRERRLMIIEGFVKVAAGFQLRFKHVKAHQANTDARSYINNSCDAAAKGHMRQVRHERQSKKGKHHEAGTAQS